MANGSILIDFGAFPGKTDTSFVVTGQTAFKTSSAANAWLVARDSNDHSADEHTVEQIKITTGNYVQGEGFTVYVTSNDPIYGQFNVIWSWR